MSTTEQYPDFSGLTFEKVWATLQETRKESHKEMQELREQMRENSRERKEAERKLDEQINQVDKQINHVDKQLDKRYKELNEQLGRLGNRFGEVMEAVVRPSVAKKFNELGYQFPSELHNLLIKDPATGNRKTELDVVLENGESVIVVEIKINPDIKDVQHFAEQLQYYREYRSMYMRGDTKKIYGALAAAVFPNNVQKVALDSGYYVIVPSGESIKIVVPEETGLKAF